ncbi:MAG: TetR/AcrR family transcriptional regulator [Candidatus Binatia bacterium]
MKLRARRKAPQRAVVRNRRGLSTRATILAAAQRLLQKRGLSALSLDAVARAARVSRSSVYHQFASREGLFLELIAEAFRRMQAETRGRKRHASALDRFLFEAERGFEVDPELLRTFYLLIFDRSWQHPELKRQLREAYRFRTQRLAAGFERDGTALPDKELETLVIVLAAALDGLYVRRIIDLEGAKLHRAFRLLGDLVESRLRGKVRTRQ